MENFIVSARKYRPTTFDSVVGQSTLTITLKNAILNKQLAHAYLFCGPRGVGKTTCARIFAKTINCQNLRSDGEACNTCESCVSFNQQRSFNIHELDAASNNSVDDIRSLIDQVRIPPQIGRYSVYIIDEVHMLSAAAFNAFLKTLEEPPAHAIFILATTEKHKIIPTILSRCQIYDFNRITVQDTVEHLKYIADKEGVTIDENALNIIAQKSDGGMRDALSIFDQLVSFSGDNISYEDVITNLNVLDYEYYFRLIDASMQADVSTVLLIFNEVLNKGFDGHHFISGLSRHLRDLLMCKDPQTVTLMEVGADIGKRYQEQAQLIDSDFLFQALKISNDCDLNYRNSQNKRLLVELTLIRIAQLKSEKKTLYKNKEKAELKKIEENEQPDVKKATKESNETKKTKKVKEIQEIKKETKTVRPSSISISSALKTNKEKTPSPVTEIRKQVTLDEDYTEEDFQNTWKSYIQNIPKKVNIVSYINSNQPQLISDHTYELSFTNSFQKNDLKKELNKIATYMQTQLKNSAIRFTTTVIKIDNKSARKNPEEIYKSMNEKNPQLGVFRKNLNLEID